MGLVSCMPPRAYGLSNTAGLHLPLPGRLVPYKCPQKRAVDNLFKFITKAILASLCFLLSHPSLLKKTKSNMKHKHIFLQFLFLKKACFEQIFNI